VRRIILVFLFIVWYGIIDFGSEWGCYGFVYAYMRLCFWGCGVGSKGSERSLAVVIIIVKELKEVDNNWKASVQVS